MKKKLTDLHLRKSEKEEIYKNTTSKKNKMKMKMKFKQLKIKDEKNMKLMKGKDELNSHFSLRSQFFELKLPKTKKEYIQMNSLSECFANMILLKVNYSDSIKKQIQSILNLSPNKNFIQNKQTIFM